MNKFEQLNTKENYKIVAHSFSEIFSTLLVVSV